jgi:hypothetical protein
MNRAFIWLQRTAHRKCPFAEQNEIARRKARWLPQDNTLRTLESLSSHEGRVTIARYRALRNELSSWINRLEWPQLETIQTQPIKSSRCRLGPKPSRRERPSIRDRAAALVLKRGEVRAKDLSDIGVPRCYLARMCDEGLLIRVGYGLYRQGPAITAKSSLLYRIDD